MHVHEMTVVTVHFAEIKQNLVAQVKRKRHAFIANALKIQVSGCSAHAACCILCPICRHTMFKTYTKYCVFTDSQHPRTTSLVTTNAIVQCKQTQAKVHIYII